MGAKKFTVGLSVRKSELSMIQKKLETLPGITFTDNNPLIKIQIKKPSGSIPKFNQAENYKLKITPMKILIEAPNEYGALYGIESLKQLIQTYGNHFPQLTISDHPRFPWRGLLVDVARNFITLKTLKIQIDLMNAVKLNVLHLHLSDDQAFRLESFSYPKLHKNNLDGKFYTQKDIKELILYASERGVRVVPEFDVPGHVSSYLAAYPELASIPGLKTPSTKYGPHDEAMNPINDFTYIFLEKLFTEMSGLFPDEFFHVGGDEVSGKHWLQNPEIVQFMKNEKIQNTTELQFRFTRHMETLVKKLGKKMMAWDEVLKGNEPLDSVAQIWRGPQFGKQALANKMPIIYSYGQYLDLQFSMERHYLMDPAEDMGLKKDPELLWGGEACMWSERAPDELLTNKIWPRAMASAERFWSARNIRDVEDFYKRQESLSASLNLNDDKLINRIHDGASEMGVEASVLEDFFSWLEPGKFYSQHRYRQINTTTKWNMWVDVAPSESKRVTQLHWQFNSWLKTRSSKEMAEIEKVILSWSTLSHSLNPMQTKEFSEKEDLVALARDLNVLSRVATDALEFLKTGARPGGLWLMESRTKLSMAGQVRSGFQLGMHALVERMVFLVGAKHQLPPR